jgi:hypothetical protein
MVNRLFSPFHDLIAGPPRAGGKRPFPNTSFLDDGEGREESPLPRSQRSFQDLLGRNEDLPASHQLIRRGATTTIPVPQSN